MKESEMSEAGKAIRNTMLGSPVAAWGKGILGAIVGAVLGYFAFSWLLNYGMYAGVLPGSLIGVGFSIAARRPLMAAGIVCGICGLIFGFWCDAHTNAPPETLVQYFQTFEQVPAANKIMIAVGGLMAFWFGKGNRHYGG